MDKSTVRATIRRVAEEEGLSAGIVLAVAWQESRFNPRAVHDGGRGFGVLGIHPRWHGFDAEHWYDVENSVRYFCREWVPKWPDVWTAVRRWNGSGDDSYAYLARVRGIVEGT